MSQDYHFADDSDGEINTFVQKENSPNKKAHGHEFDPDVANDEQFIAKIFKTESLNHTVQSTIEFYSDVFYVMNNKKVNNRKTVGDMITKKKKGTACGGFSSSNKLKQRISQEDIYVMKLQAFLNLAKIQEFTSKYDINNLRLYIEMVLEESIAALNISIFHKQKEVKKYLSELRKILISDAYLDAMFLSCRLFKASFKYQNMEDAENLLSAAKRINAVFITYIKLFESDRNFLNKQKKSHTYVVYEKMKKILAKQNIKDISKANPIHLVNSEMSGKIKDFMDSEVNPHTRMIDAVAVPNPSVTQNADLMSPRASHYQGGEPPLMVLIEASPANEDSPHEQQQPKDVKIMLSSVAENNNEEVLDASDVEIVENISPGLKPLPPKISNLSDLEASKKMHESFMTEHLTGPTPRMEFVGRKDLESGDCEMSYVSEDQLIAGRESSDPQSGTFAHLARKATLGTRARGASRYKPIHNTEIEHQSPGKVGGLMSPMNKLTKMLSFGPGAAGNGTTRNAAKRKTTKVNAGSNNHLEFEANELTDQSPIKSVIKKNEQIFKFDVAQVEQEEIIEQPKIDEAFVRVVDIGNDYHSKWERVVNNPLIQIDKIMPEGSPVVLIRAWALIEGFTPKEVFDQIFDTEKRAKWETVTMGLSVVEMINEFSQIMYFYIKTPIGITERDFVQKRNYMLDYPKKGEITMTFKSVVHEKAPPIKGRIRGETHISGYIMRPSTKVPNSTDFCIISQSDIKGSIPKMIVNSVSSKAPAEWIRKLIQACDRDRKASQQGK